MNLVERLIQKAEELGWIVSVDDNYWEFNQSSPAGEDFFFGVSGYGSQIVSEVKEYYENFDPEEHAIDLIVAKKNGFESVPDIRTVRDDADAIDEMLHELFDAFVEVESLCRDENEDEEEEE